jgi:subtilisin family serine protease
VVIIDTGVQQNHPDINQITPGIDTTTETGAGGPNNGCDNHGTAVAGCVSATINNAIGVAGVAPNCRSASARTFISTLDCSGGWSSSSSWTVSALAWAEQIGARVTNNSNYYGFTSSAIAQKYADTRAGGMVHFAVAGNFAQASLEYPASLNSVNAVAATNRFGDRASFSSWGAGLAFSAPGESILTTDRTGSAGYSSSNYATLNGTSFATPYAAGVAALALSVNPNLSAVEVEQLMQQTCINLGPPGYDTGTGWGHVNALNVVEQACASCCLADFVSAATFEPPPDGQVDGVDLAFLLGAWGAVSGAGSPADIVTNPTFEPPPDGVVDGADLAVLLGSWGACD